jgi:phage terminase large subunit-like protein
MYDKQKGERVVKFIERLTSHTKGELAGKPFILEEFQKKVIRDVFGNINKDGNRIIREAFLFWPRKNGKTNFLAALGLYLLVSDNEPGAEIIVCAADRGQAGMIHEIQKQMVLQSPILMEQLKVYRNSIVKKDGSFIQARSADADTAHGYNAHAVLFDELHSQPNRELYDVMKTASGARRQPLFFSISTAGFNKESICYEVYDYAKKVQAGIIEDKTFYPNIFEADPEDDIQDPATWRKANPGYGVTIKEDYIEAQAAKAKTLVTYENTFRRLHLNQWTTSEVRWVSDEDFMSCSEQYGPNDLEGRDCFAGLDLASTEDLCAYVLIFPPIHEDEPFKTLVFSWVTEAAVEKRQGKTGADYNKFIAKGELDVTPGNVTDYRYISKVILESADKYNVRAIAFDRWNSSSLVGDLAEEGLPVEPYGQGFASMSPAIKQLEIWIRSKQIAHTGNNLLRWNVSNVQAKSDAAGNLKFDKSKSSDKIDVAQAWAMAVGIWLAKHRSDDDRGSIYDERDLIIL